MRYFAVINDENYVVNCIVCEDNVLQEFLIHLKGSNKDIIEYKQEAGVGAYIGGRYDAVTDTFLPPDEVV